MRFFYTSSQQSLTASISASRFGKMLQEEWKKRQDTTEHQKYSEKNMTNYLADIRRSKTTMLNQVRLHSNLLIHLAIEIVEDGTYLLIHFTLFTPCLSEMDDGTTAGQ